MAPVHEVEFPPTAHPIPPSRVARLGRHLTVRVRVMSEAPSVTNLIGNAAATVVIARGDGAFAPEACDVGAEAVRHGR